MQWRKFRLGCLCELSLKGFSKVFLFSALFKDIFFQNIFFTFQRLSVATFDQRPLLMSANSEVDTKILNTEPRARLVPQRLIFVEIWLFSKNKGVFCRCYFAEAESHISPLRRCWYVVIVIMFNKCILCVN